MSRQSKRAISIGQQSALESGLLGSTLEHKRAFNLNLDHNAPNLKGQPVNIYFFQTAFQGNIQTCLQCKGN